MSDRSFGDDRDDDLEVLRRMPLPTLPDPVLPGLADRRILGPHPRAEEEER
jgi:hypothetical protein